MFLMGTPVGKSWFVRQSVDPKVDMRIPAGFSSEVPGSRFDSLELFWIKRKKT